MYLMGNRRFRQTLYYNRVISQLMEIYFSNDATGALKVDV